MSILAAIIWKINFKPKSTWYISSYNPVINNIDKTIEFIDKSGYMVNKYKILVDFYKKYKH